MPLRRFFLNTRIFGPRVLAVDDGDDARVGDERRAGEDFAAVLFDEQHLVERELGARLAGGPATRVATPPGVTLT